MIVMTVSFNVSSRFLIAAHKMFVLLLLLRVWTQAAGYVGRIVCPPARVLCSADDTLLSTVPCESHGSYEELQLTSVVNDVTSFDVRSYSEFD